MIQVKLFAVAAMALIASCASTPTPTELTEPGTLLTDAFSTAAPGTGRIFVKRDSILTRRTRFGCAHRIYIDGTPVAELFAAQSVSIHLKPGDHILSAELTTILCNGTSETSVTVREGETKTFRTSTTDGNKTVQPTVF